MSVFEDQVIVYGDHMFNRELDPFGRWYDIFRSNSRESKRSLDEIKQDCRQYILDYTNTLMTWALHSKQLHNEFLKGMLESYCFIAMPMKGGKLDTNGYFIYPEDPPLTPMLRLTSDNEVIHFYDYALFSVVKILADGRWDLDNFVMYRMD